MWMMGYNYGAESKVPDSFNGRSLRHLIPRPSSSNNNASVNQPPYLSHIHGSDLLALSHYPAVVPEQSKKEFSTQQFVVSSRWNPTPEQLQALEELYQSGTRTPSADQIQHITGQLRRYGKIEGKNVFYWFQNHKARERQKRRYQLEPATDDQHVRDMEKTERKETGSNRTGFKVEKTTKNWASPTNCSTLSERATKAAVSERRADGWVQFEDDELQQRRSLGEKNARWQMMQLSCSSNIHPITCTRITTSNTNTVQATAASATMDPKTIKPKDQSVFNVPHKVEYNILINNHYARVAGGHHASCQTGLCGAEKEARTLQLFPLQSPSCSNDENENVADEKEEISTSDMNANYTPYQFFEFLPSKN